MSITLRFSFVIFILATTLSQATEIPTEQRRSEAQLIGSITPERAWWDLKHYRLELAVDIEKKYFTGKNTVTYEVLAPAKRLQIDLKAPMQIDKVIQNGQVLEFDKQGAVHFIKLKQDQPIGSTMTVEIHFSGKPKVAKNAPWESGITWSTDSNGLAFVANANQAEGPSVWWPAKNHEYDEPDNGVDILVETPEHLMNVSNGRLIETKYNKSNKSKIWHWRVTNPINGYGVNISIGDYVHFGETYEGEGGTLDMDYYVLKENFEKAQKQFKEAKRTIEALEYWFGPYPFYEDSYKLVDVPYLGMEHQSSVTYGNGYQNGYKGRDRSESGAGMLFDFIVVHETGHEWFANNITAKDPADLWVHESFTSYSESLFLEYHFNKHTAFKYVRGQRINIGNQSTIEGKYDFRSRGSTDMYDKGANILHTIRQIVNNDAIWRQSLRGLNKTFWHQTVTGKQIEEFISSNTGKDFTKLFDQYLRDIRIPQIELYQSSKGLKYRWQNVIKDFDMPIRIYIDDEETWLSPTTKWQLIERDNKAKDIHVDKNFYVSALIY